MAGGDQKNTTHDNAIGWLILGGIFLALFALFWHFFKYEIKSAFRWWRWGEMWLISHFVGDDYSVKWNGYDVDFKQWLEGVPLIPAENLDASTLGAISLLAMTPFKFPFMIVMGLMALWVVMYGPGTQYRRKLNLDGLIGVQSKTFPVIAPFVKFNPAHQPPRPPGAPVPAELPLFAEALGPEEWLAYNQIPVPDGEIDENAAFIAFARQLGGRWQGPGKLAPYKQALLAAFCLKASRKRKEADDMLGRIAKCWSPEGGLELGKDKALMKDVRKVLRNKDLAASTLSKCNHHGFETTALLRALATAREEGGVLAPAQFLWLRGYDRVLWYPLNNLGRQSYHMEALGAMAHFKAERLTRRPIPKPKVEGAIETITGYMKSARARPIPQLDYSGSKQKGVKKPKARRA